MQRDIHLLKKNSFDVIVVGAGIHGTCVARDAALRGLRVAIIDKHDIGGGTSHNSLKTIHGGIRYLQQLNIKRTVLSIREQAIFYKIAPHLVNPLDFLMPLYGWGMRSPIVMWLALNFFYLLCRLNGSPVSKGQIFSTKYVQKKYPTLPKAGMTGGAQWPELQITYADRAILEMLEDVYRHGGVVANYLEATSLTVRNGSVSSIELTDVTNGEVFPITADVIVNAAGPWASELAASIKSDKQPSMSTPLTKSMNLVLNRRYCDVALGVSNQSGNGSRLYFIVPWQDRSIAGTTHFPHQNKTVDSQASQSEIDEFLTELNNCSPTHEFSRKDVLYAYQGLTPAVAEGESVKRPEHSTVIDHKGRDGITNLFSIIGIKWTTARQVAEETVDMVCDVLDVDADCVTRERPIPAMRTIGNSTTNLGTGELEKFCKAHIEHTLALDLSDIVLRRTDDLVCGRMTISTFTKIAKIVARNFGWNNEQLLEAVDRLSVSGLSNNRVVALKEGLASTGLQ